VQRNGNIFEKNIFFVTIQTNKRNMSQLTPRNIDILRIIVEEFISTGEVL
jgi:hypothetical protein